MTVREAIDDAEAVLPGVPAPADARDERWQRILEVGSYLRDEPEAVWGFVARWGGHEQEDLRSAIATCLLEHLLEHHFALLFPRVEALAAADPLFADTFKKCWKLGQAEQPENAARFDSLATRL